MIATAELPDTVTIEPYEGTTGLGGQSFGDPVTVRARVVGQRRQVRTSGGVDLVADATIRVRPNLTVDVPPESRVTDQNGNVWTVVAAATAVELRRPHHVDLIVTGPRLEAA